MKASDGLRLPARAKLNLVLRIVGRRADGYHLLETLFHAIELHDDLWLARRQHGITLRVTADEPQLAVPPDADNLVVRALARLGDAVGGAPGFAAHLHKRIPHGAGLGGGSSDAAAALRLGNELLGAPLDPAQLARLGAGLGADVPFFLRGGSQWGRGVGDELEPAAVPPMHFVLVVPPFGCATADVYKNHAAHWQSGAPQDSVRSVTGPATRDSAVHSGFCNDLEPAAERVRPELAVLRRRIVALGHPDVCMTGSGSTLFLAMADAARAAQCAAGLEELAAAGVRVVTTRSAGEAIDVPVRAGCSADDPADSTAPQRPRRDHEGPNGG
ncbi:MAG: 4-(cytidine 5'-diphospho)-2-C-methyl-D-erythritol kinase [Planctomycetes bacterium]|nr:4-(cytidine 5'-diphospho)-2-C-methyl-D-erythritol kinase [Planctomycetota bacterium]